VRAVDNVHQVDGGPGERHAILAKPLTELRSVHAVLVFLALQSHTQGISDSQPKQYLSIVQMANINDFFEQTLNFCIPQFFVL